MIHNSSDIARNGQATSDGMPVLIGLSKAALILGIHRSTAYDHARRGAFPVPVLRIGKLLKVNTRHLGSTWMGTERPTKSLSLAPRGDILTGVASAAIPRWVIEAKLTGPPALFLARERTKLRPGPACVQKSN